MLGFIIILLFINLIMMMLMTITLTTGTTVTTNTDDLSVLFDKGVMNDCIAIDALNIRTRD